MIFQFKSKDEAHSIMDKGPWMFGGITLSFNYDALILFSIRTKYPKFWFGFDFKVYRSLCEMKWDLEWPSYNEQTLSDTRLDYAQVCIELNVLSFIVYNFQLKCK
jgi:hypothetical protein